MRSCLGWNGRELLVSGGMLAFTGPVLGVFREKHSGTWVGFSLEASNPFFLEENLCPSGQSLAEDNSNVDLAVSSFVWSQHPLPPD